MRSRWLAVGLMTTSLVGAPAIGASGSPEATIVATQDGAAERIPADALAVVALRAPNEAIKQFRAWYAANEIGRTGAGELLETNPGFNQARIGLLGVAAAAGMDPWQAIGSVLGRETVIAITPPPEPGGEPTVLAAVSLEDARGLDRLLNIAKALGGMNRRGAGQEAAQRINGFELTALGEQAFLARKGDTLLLSNDRDTITDSIRLSARNSIVGNADFRAARDLASPDAAAWAYLDADVVQQAMRSQGVTEMASNPLAGLVLGAWRHAALHADAGVAWIEPTRNGIEVEMRVRTPEEPPRWRRGFTPQHEMAAGVDADRLDGLVGSVTLSRDWAVLFAERESLLTVPAANQFVEFSNNITTLMGGLDFIDDVMGRVVGPVQLIATRQSFEGAVPQPALPGFALIAPIDPEGVPRFDQRVQSGLINLLSIINLQRQQQNQPPSETGLVEIDGRMVAYGRYYAEPGAETAPVEANFAPHALVLDDRLIVSSSIELTRSIAAAMKAGRPEAEPTARDSIRVLGAELLGELRRNERELVANRMLEEDLSRDRATRDIEQILKAVELLDAVTLESAHDGAWLTATLRVELTAAED